MSEKLRKLQSINSAKRDIKEVLNASLTAFSSTRTISVDETENWEEEITRSFKHYKTVLLDKIPSKEEVFKNIEENF